MREEARKRVTELRREAHAKVVRLRMEQQFSPQQMSFADKMAYFTTARVGVHEDIQRQVMEEELGRRASKGAKDMSSTTQ